MFYPFPGVLATLGMKIYPPTDILLVIFPAEISLYGSNCSKEAKSCVQPWVPPRWGRTVELQQDQPGLGKDSVPELPGSALGAPALLCPARPCEEWIIKGCRLRADIHLKTLQDGCQAFRGAVLLCGSQAFSRCSHRQSITYLNIKIQHAEKRIRF